MKQLKNMEVSVFCRNTAMMLNAGVAPEESVTLLREAGEEPAFQAVAGALDEQMQQGVSFAEAVAHSGAFPDYAAKMIAAGETAGRLEEVLLSLADYYERQDSLHRQLRGALFYPMLLLLLMCGVLVLLVAVVLPVFVSVYENMSGALAASSYRYIRVSAVISWVSLIVTGVAALAVLTCGVLSASDAGSRKLGHFLAVFPPTRGVSRQMAAAHMMEMLSTFLASGLDSDSAMQETVQAVTHPALRREAEEMYAAMQQGAGLAEVLGEHKLFDALYARMLLSAAHSGQLGATLAQVAQRSELEAEERIQYTAEAVEPVMTGFLTVAVGLSLLSIMLPLAGILSAMG